MMLQRTSTLASLLAGTEDRLIVTGLGSAANDVAFITDFAPRAFTMDGVMGAAASVGLGVALAQPGREVLVVTGDGELLMNIGSLATIALQNPQNLRIIVLDNGLYGLTGGQATATSSVADIEVIAQGAGIRRTMTVRSEEDFAAARALIATRGDTALILVKVEKGPAAAVRIDRDGSKLRSRFRSYVLEEASR
jgi:thiamine pyrophosphate-dependent acetolactate synthase large subunit-like protein